MNGFFETRARATPTASVFPMKNTITVRRIVIHAPWRSLGNRPRKKSSDMRPSSCCALCPPHAAAEAPLDEMDADVRSHGQQQEHRRRDEVEEEVVFRRPGGGLAGEQQLAEADDAYEGAVLQDADPEVAQARQRIAEHQG